MHTEWEFDFKDKKVRIYKHLDSDEYFIMTGQTKTQHRLRLVEVVSWMANAMMDCK